MPDLNEKLIEHLNNAYAMEQNVSRMLERMIETTDDPAMLDMLEHHRSETQRHAERLEQHYGRKLPFGPFLKGLRDRGADDLELGELVAFLLQHTA